MRIVQPLVVSLLLLSGCGGFRGGTTSVPYVGEVAPDVPSPRTPYELHRRRSIRLPGLVLDVALNDTVRTYGYEVALYIIPMQIDFGDPARRSVDRLEVALGIQALEPGFSFDPARITLTVDGQELSPVDVWLDDPQRRRRVLESFLERQRSADAASPPALDPAQWRDPVSGVVTLTASEQTYRFTLTFDKPVPPASEGIALRLDRALTHQQRPAVPLIRFKRIAWSEGYS